MVPRWLFFAVLVLTFSAPLLAQKTDVIVMADGDRYTGEIKSYGEGRLKLDTKDAGVVSIKWNKIGSIASEKVFDIELPDGSHRFGSLAPTTPPGKLAIVSDAGTSELDFFSVVRITPIYQTFWRRIDGSLNLGFNYTEAHQFVQFNLNADATYRARGFAVFLDLSAFLSRQEEVTNSQRASLSLGYQYTLSNRWFLAGLAGLERNRDLGLDLRVTLGGGAGRHLIQTNRTLLDALVAVTVNREDPIEGGATKSAEAVIAGRYRTFAYDFPKLTVEAGLDVIPSLTDGGRVRLEANARVKREIVSDFYVSLSIFDSYDSRPPTAGAAKNDWGPVFSLGWTF